MQEYRVVWAIQALNSFEYYIDWYIKQGGNKVGQNFIDTVEKYITKIKINPHIARKVPEVEDLKELVIEKYPFLISFYVKDEKTIIITSFLHQRLKI